MLCLLTGCVSTVPESAASSIVVEAAMVDSPDRLLVYASFFPMYDFAGKIGGDRIELRNMIPVGADPHDWEPTPALIAGLSGADVFIYNGAGMEHWVDTVLASLENENLTVVETGAGLPLLKGGCARHHFHNDCDDPFDSHVWLNPLLAKLQMAAIKDALAAADPNNRDYFETNFNFYAEELDRLDAEFRETLTPLPNNVIVVAHEAFGYLADAYGLIQMGITGLQPDTEPTPARMAEVITFVKENSIGTIFFEELASPRVAEAIVGATGTQVAALNPLEGLTDAEIAEGADYFSVMRNNLEALRRALE